ncbi:MAG TPA: hypothetical protein VLA43_19540 [Longimicrobiales bacterium]|nr:hypothetical protein [Longimicrobiales bacterium]
MALLAAAGCGEAPNELQPGELLRDSLGLTSLDRVHVVRITHREGREVATPDSLLVRPGDWVDFVGGDGWIRVVAFPFDSLDLAPRDFMEGNGVDASPPLLGADVHWAVPFTAAPPGRYPFSVMGSGAPGRGVVVVESRR